jgi:hypothetical protein
VHVSDPPSPWAGYQLCLRSALDAPTEATHALVVQDDVTLCPNFVPAVEKIADANPNTPVCLFLARLPADAAARATRALKYGDRYVTFGLRSFVPVVALLWPSAKAEEFMEWVGSGVKLPGESNPRSDDAVVGRWMATTRQEIKATVPSLVEHPDLEPSLIGRRRAWGQDKGRVALHLAEDGLAYDW